MGIAEQGAASINPFFFRFTRPYLLATLVGVSMVGGVAGLTIFNMRCSGITTAEEHYERVVGNWEVQKLWVEEKATRPSGLSAEVRREVNICLMAANAPRYYTTTTSAGNQLIESIETCAPL